MSKNQDSDLSYFKELGSLQETVLFFLAENPNMHKQAIQKGIGYPPSQYGNVLKTVNTLEKQKFIKSKKGTSQKKVPIKIYSCTENGVFYALAKNPEGEIKRIVDNHKKDYPIFTPFLDLYSVWGRERTRRFFEHSFEFILIMKKEGQEKALSFLLMKMHIEGQDLDSKTRKKIAKDTLKLFPKTRKTMTEMREILDEILRE